MAEIYFRQATSIVVEDPSDSEAIKPLKEGLPRGAQRRMTLMGLMMHRMLEGRDLSPASSIVYMTAFGESRTMKDYIGTYPFPSPMGFQSSIHPSAVEQSLILRRQAVRFYLPLAGRAALAQSLRVAQTLPAGSVLCGAEERETWLAENHLSSALTYAWATTLCPADEAEGKFIWEGAPMDAAPTGRPSEMVAAMAQKKPWGWSRPGIAKLDLQWL